MTQLNRDPHTQLAASHALPPAPVDFGPRELAGLATAHALPHRTTTTRHQDTAALRDLHQQAASPVPATVVATTAVILASATHAVARALSAGPSAGADTNQPSVPSVPPAPGWGEELRRLVGDSVRLDRVRADVAAGRLGKPADLAFVLAELDEANQTIDDLVTVLDDHPTHAERRQAHHRRGLAVAGAGLILAAALASVIQGRRSRA